MTEPNWREIADRLAARLRVHAHNTSTGYLQDPLSDLSVPDIPGMSNRWSVSDQYALGFYEVAVKEADNE